MNEYVQKHRKSFSWWTLACMAAATFVLGYCLSAEHRHVNAGSRSAIHVSSHR